MKVDAILYVINGKPQIFADSTMTRISLDARLATMRAAFPENEPRIAPVVVLENTERGLVFDMRGIPEHLRECEDPDMPDTLIPPRDPFGPSLDEIGRQAAADTRDAIREAKEMGARLDAESARRAGVPRGEMETMTGEEK